MGKDSGTKCSHCGKNGHNSRTCGVGGGGGSKSVKIFGVKMSPNKKEDPIKKSFSMGNLPAIVAELAGDDDIGRGYLSDGPLRSKKEGSHERKKGVPWTAEEHRTFLEGLKKLGKGDWRGISRSYVTTRTPTQVASHAQKYFLRQTAANKKKRRASLFDMAIKETGETSNSTMKDSNNYPKQAGSSVQVGNQVAASHGIQAPPTMPMARTPSIPQINNIPYMVGPPGYMKPEGYSASVSVVPVVNICNVGYSYQPKHQNSYAGYTPFPSQPYITSFSPPAVQHCAVKLEPHSSSTVNTDLKLSTTPTEVGDRTKLPTHSSNMNGAIGVI